MTYENAWSLKKFIGNVFAFEKSLYLAKVQRMNRKEGFKICKEQIGYIATRYLSDDFILEISLGDNSFLCVKVTYKVTGSCVFMTDFEFHSDSRHKL